MEVSRWKEHLKALEDLKVGTKQIGRVVFSKEKKIATGSNGSQIFLGMMDGKIPVAVKRLQKGIPSSDVTAGEILRNKKILSTSYQIWQLKKIKISTTVSHHSFLSFCICLSHQMVMAICFCQTLGFLVNCCLVPLCLQRPWDLCVRCVQTAWKVISASAKSPQIFR
ncbi:hypothetical protein HOLleu_11155 [Holothuria leucospilota]|uniref:Uncharacterized protein n=1 Tax=Holothuria leucospilota TaxID=206669 RepID=A0A9Q1CFT1_HOLLE|nr:hypothetical protein HOLleu_11155 [Holothuria leucospilota]